MKHRSVFEMVRKRAGWQAAGTFWMASRAQRIRKLAFIQSFTMDHGWLRSLWVAGND